MAHGVKNSGTCHKIGTYLSHENLLHLFYTFSNIMNI